MTGARLPAAAAIAAALAVVGQRVQFASVSNAIAVP